MRPLINGSSVTSYNTTSHKFNSLKIDIKAQASSWAPFPLSRILFCGGNSRESKWTANSIIINTLDYNTECVDSMMQARFDHTIIYYLEYIYTFCGITSQGPTQTWEKFCVRTKKWKFISNMPDFSGTVLKYSNWWIVNGKIYTAASRGNIIVYFPRLDSFSHIDLHIW